MIGQVFAVMVVWLMTVVMGCTVVIGVPLLVGEVVANVSRSARAGEAVAILGMMGMLAGSVAFFGMV